MNASRSVLRAQRAIRISNVTIGVRRYASEGGKPAVSGAVTGGLAGGAAALAIAYGWYHFSGAKTAVQTARQAKSYVDDAINSVKLQLPDKVANPNDALQVLRDSALKYAAFIPGGKGYVESAFKDVDAIRKHHGDEVDKIVHEAYEDLRKVAKKGLSLEAAGEAIDVLANHLSRLYSIAGDATEDILEGHPELKKKIGGSSEQIKKFAERYGQDAKKQVEDVREQVREIVKNGLNWDTLQKIQKMAEEKTEQAKDFGHDLVSQGSDELKPFLDSNPKIKELIEGNMQVLKDGNIAETLNAIYKAATSGDVKSLEEFIKQAKEKK